MQAIRDAGCLPLATPFDESSVDFCCKLGIPILKIASSDCNDWILIEKIAKTKKPVIVSTGGSSLKDIDDLVTFFDNRHIPIAINHCVSLYPSEDSEIELNQIDFLRNRYPNHTIGFSTHEYHDWTSSMLMAYAKGARTFERHVDIQTEGMTVSPYCSLPEQVDTWFKAFHRAKRMCGAPGNTEASASAKRNLLSRLARARSLCATRSSARVTCYKMPTSILPIPLQQGQISCRELMRGEVIRKAVPKDQPIMIDAIDSPYANIPSLTELIYHRGLPPQPAAQSAKAGGEMTEQTATKTISVVTPCYNEEGNVREVYERVRDLMLKLGRYRYEHIFIDNASRDNTFRDSAGDCRSRFQRQTHSQRAQLRTHPLSHARHVSGVRRRRDRPDVRSSGSA